MTNEKTQKPEEKKTEKKTAGALTAVIRISGMVKVREVIVDLNNKSMAGILKKVKHYVAYGEIDKTTLVKLIKARGKSIDGDKKEIKIDSEKVAEDLMNGKKLTELGLKGFFWLAPPKKGINSKLQYPKGVLGNNKKDINKLIERML